jgi:hypothetical protein
MCKSLVCLTGASVVYVSLYSSANKITKLSYIIIIHSMYMGVVFYICVKMFLLQP